MSDWRVREVRNETVARDLNEHIRGNGQERSPRTTSYMCECSDGACLARVDLTTRQYEDVRSSALAFVIARDHENPEIDALLEEHDGFAVVRKLPGMPSRLAIAADPRRVA